MKNYFKLADGRFIKTGEYTEVTADDVKQVIEGKEAQLSHLRELVETPQEEPAPAPAPETPAPTTPPATDGPEAIEVNGQSVPANADGTIKIDVTPEQPAAAEPAPLQETQLDPVAAAAGAQVPVTPPTPPQDTTTGPAPVVLQ